MAVTSGKNRITIYGPKSDGTYVIEFITANGGSLAISVPSGETAVLKYLQEHSLAQAHEAIGEYFCVFSSLERELGEAIKVVLRLQGNAAANAIVALVGDFGRKARIVREAVQTAKKVDGTDPDENWKANADKIMGEILGCNNPDRTDLAHDYLEPQADGSVSLQKPGSSPRPWTTQDFDRKIAKLKELAIKLNTVTTDLTTLSIPVPTGWMSVDPFQPRVRQFPPSDLGTGSSFDQPPLTIRTTDQKERD